MIVTNICSQLFNSNKLLCGLARDNRGQVIPTEDGPLRIVHLSRRQVTTYVVMNAMAIIVKVHESIIKTIMDSLN